MPNNLNLVKLLENVINTERSIIVTIPSNISWSDYEKELKKVEDYSNELNYKVPFFPKGIKKGDKCYLVHNGYVMGWMEITGMEEKKFVCNTTGKEWNGKFILRSGPFHYLDNKIKMKGFQGFRYFSIDDYQ